MKEIHIVRSKKYPNTGYHVEKNAYEKYGISCLVYCPNLHTLLNTNNTEVFCGYTGIEKILCENDLFEPTSCYSIEEYPTNSSFPFTWSWTLPENEIIRIAAQHGIKVVFEDKLSLHTDFMNPANTIDVTLLADSSDTPCYTMIQNYDDYIESFIMTNILKQVQSKLPYTKKDYSELTPEELEQDDEFYNILGKTQIRCQDLLSDVTEYRITTSLKALGGKQHNYRKITYDKKIDDAFITRAKAEQNLNITVKQVSLDTLNDVLNHVSDIIMKDINIQYDFFKKLR